MRNAIKYLLFVGAIFVMGNSTAAHAFVVNIDNFQVLRTPRGGGAITNFMNDTFDTPGPLNEAGLFAASGNQGFYDLTNGVAQSEALGTEHRTLNTSLAPKQASSVNPGTFIRQTAARLNTNIDPLPVSCRTPTTGTSCGGLKSIREIKVVGIFDFVVPPFNPLGASFYEIRLFDRIDSNNPGDDELALQVFRSNNSGNTLVRFRDADRTAGTSVTLGVDALFGPELAHEQIMLMIQNSLNDLSVFTASYAFGDGGVFGNPIPLAGAGTIFNGEDWTRAAFRALETETVPEPGTISMLLFGLAGLGLMRRRKRAAA